MSKWYVVKNGRKPGIYKTWDECKAQTDGYSGAVFKSFLSEYEAKEYFYSTDARNGLVFEATLDKKGKLLAYTDGSYTSGSYNEGKQPLSGYGVVFVIDDNIVGEFCGECNLSPKIRNIGGELMAAMQAVKMAYEAGYQELIICHDLQNIQMWGNNLWKTNIKETQEFRDYITEIRKQGFLIEFAWVKGHNGNKYNSHADTLAAKGAAGKHVDYLVPHE